MDILSTLCPFCAVFANLLLATVTVPIVVILSISPYPLLNGKNRDKLECRKVTDIAYYGSRYDRRKYVGEICVPVKFRRSIMADDNDIILLSGGR